MIDFAEIKAGIEFGELYEFDAKQRKFVKAENNVLGIGVHGKEGYDCVRVLVQLGDLIVAFKQDAEDICKFVLDENAVGEAKDVYPFIIAKRIKNEEEVLEAIVHKIPAPSGDAEKPLQALIFDSIYDSYKGVIIFCRVME